MIMWQQCRVRKLKVKTEDKTLLPRLSFLLEDALRTAQFPGVPFNGMVYIKQLRLKHLSAGMSSQVISTHIDNLIRSSRPAKISTCTDHESSSEIVWFSDAIEPCRILLELVSRGVFPETWYWPVAVKGWSSQMTYQQSVQHILNFVLQQKADISTVAYILSSLVETGELVNVVDNLQIPWLKQLLENTGQASKLNTAEIRLYQQKKTSLISKDKMNLYNQLPQPWRQILQDSIHRWPVHSARNLLLASLALQNKSINTGNTGINTQASILLYQVWMQSKAEVDKFAQQTSEIKNGYNRKAVPDIPLDTLTEISSQDYYEIKKTDSEQEFVEYDSSITSNITVDLRHKNLVQEKGKIQESNNKRSDEYDSSITNNITVDQKHKKLVQDKASAQKSSHTNENVDISSSVYFGPLQQFLIGEYAGHVSENAGLVYIVSCMKLLGFDELYKNFPENYDYQLAERVLWKIINRLDIPATDPVCQFISNVDLTGLTKYTNNKVINFVAPVHWSEWFSVKQKSLATMQVRSIDHVFGRRLIIDKQGRLVAGVWTKDNRSAMQDWIDRANIEFKSSKVKHWTIDDLVNNIILMISRYCRVYANCSIRQIVYRPAYIAVSQTHVDVTTPLELLDINVRVAGLDINPGWLPWLDRVFYFHYLENEVS